MKKKKKNIGLRNRWGKKETLEKVKSEFCDAKTGYGAVT